MYRTTVPELPLSTIRSTTKYVVLAGTGMMIGYSYCLLSVLVWYPRTVSRVLWVLGIVGLVYRRLVSSVFVKYWYVWYQYYIGYSRYGGLLTVVVYSTHIYLMIT